MSTPSTWRGLAVSTRRCLLPLRHRGAETQVDLALLRSRNALVRARTRLISHARGITKSLGARLPACSTESFADKAGACVPGELRPALAPVLTVIAQLSDEIRALDKKIEEMAEERYPETALLTQVAGVGTLTATVYVLTLEDPQRFPRSRSVGSYLGLRPRDSGSLQPQLRITKAGDEHLRWLLVGRPTTSSDPSAPIPTCGAGASSLQRRVAGPPRSGRRWRSPASSPCCFCASRPQERSMSPYATPGSALSLWRRRVERLKSCGERRFERMAASSKRRERS